MQEQLPTTAWMASDVPTSLWHSPHTCGSQEVRLQEVGGRITPGASDREQCRTIPWMESVESRQER
jgi:hypothetical protein